MATITTTTFIVNETEYSIPGEMTAAQVVAAYSSTVPGLGGMTSSVVESGSTRTITFTPRTGTKG